MKMFSLVASLLLAGCTTPGTPGTTGTNGVVEIAPNTYMIGGLGGMTDYSGSAVKARFYKEAAKYCADKGLGMTPLNSSSQDAGVYQYASAEIQFRCTQNR